MIGIAGLYRHDPAAKADLEPLLRCAPERYQRASIGGSGASLGRVCHRLDRAGGIAREVGSWSAVVSGEIYNLADFRDQAGEPADAASLIQRLAAANALDRLADANGEFCAAAYDRAHHRLVLITDRLSTWPILYWRDHRAVVFATQLHILLGHADVPRRADPEAIPQLFTMLRVIGETTPVAGVRSVPAATIFEIDRDGMRARQYWVLDWHRNGISADEAAPAVAAALHAAVARRQTDAECERVGLLLSGGLDSRMVLAAGNRPITCWTTASYEGNPELALAKRAASLFGAAHRTALVEPATTLRYHDDAVAASGGFYPASTSVAALMAQAAEDLDVTLTGHGLDYTFRGYYLPARFLKLAGSRTRLPTLRSLPRRPSGMDVLEALRQGPPRSTVDRIVRSKVRVDWWHGVADTLGRVLKPWLEGEDPTNAWDAFILHAVSKHYAFTGMMAIRAETDLRIPAFDNDLFEIYLSMPPQWRIAGRVAQRAMRLLSRPGARLANSNTGFRADLPGWLEITGLLCRGASRRLGLAAWPEVPSAGHSAGSWQNLAGLYRESPAFRERFLAIRSRLETLCFGLLDADGLATCIDEHLAGVADHSKLLRQLMTHDAWVRHFRIETA